MVDVQFDMKRTGDSPELARGSPAEIRPFLIRPSTTSVTHPHRLDGSYGDEHVEAQRHRDGCIPRQRQLELQYNIGPLQPEIMAPRLLVR